MFDEVAGIYPLVESKRKVLYSWMADAEDMVQGSTIRWRSGIWKILE
jgi:hypothetical protein